MWSGTGHEGEDQSTRLMSLLNRGLLRQYSRSWLHDSLMNSHCGMKARVLTAGP